MAQQQRMQNPFIASSRGIPSPLKQFPILGEETEAMRMLKSSLGYKQAGMAGRQRQERAVSMGLPAYIDVSQVRQAGLDEFGRARYIAPKPLPFGSYGANATQNPPKGYFGYKEKESQFSQLPTFPTGGPQPAQGTADIAGGVAPTPNELSLPFREGEYSFGSPNMGMGGVGSYSPPSTSPTSRFGLGGSSLTSPLATPSPAIPFPTREEKILNPYGLSNY